MMQIAWSSIIEVPYCFSRSFIKLQGHTAKKSSNLTQIERFRTVTPVWIHWWIWNDTQSLMWYRRRALLFFGVIHQISRSHGRKIGDLNPIWVRLLGRSQLSNPSDLPCLRWILQYLFQHPLLKNRRFSTRYNEHIGHTLPGPMTNCGTTKYVVNVTLPTKMYVSQVKIWLPSSL